MPAIDGDVIKAVAEFVLPDGVIGQNVFWFQADLTAQANNPALEDAVKNYLDDFYAYLDDYMCDDVYVNPCEISRMEYDTLTYKWVVAAQIGFVTPTLSLTNSDDPAPNVVAPSVIGKTNRPKSRGRKQLLGFVETAFLDNDVLTGVLTALGNAAAVYITDTTVSTLGSLVPGVVRRGIDEFWKFIEGEANSIVGTMRTRKPGVGA